ncbi:beta-propeller domain-containing protein [Actinomadura sp. ATCC 31491]|uniref:Beta-propeller domain-containing protein n=1 Tax=Actinomadura luzonensis TaxID=2805427 RepID=A0ABT0FS53_9ACTN|nr:beta-propeller domain-containing protein [Actinomadura luzonensis]MCK2215169.1 beta-propeller domain-containing protein [Actinomadura luzonensis]
MKTLIRTAAAVAALATAAAACTPAAEDEPARPKPVSLGAVRLVAYTSCDDLLAGLREHTARNVSAYGLGNVFPMAMAREDTASVAKAESTPEHSTTNVHEAGVDEPDLVKTDGDRVVTVTNGTLRVVDTATREVTGSLDLTEGDQRFYAPADLLLSGDRALVLFRGYGDVMVKTTGLVPAGDTRYVLVDLAGARPKVIGTVKPQGTYVDARMVGSTVRIVTRSQPEIEFPQPGEKSTEADLLKANQETVRRAPLQAWLPKVQITDAAGRTTDGTVPCERISHPADYTGTSLLTVHTLDLSKGLTGAGTDPIALAADGDIVYGTGTSLYVASNPRWWWPLPPAPVEETPAKPSGDAPAEEPTPSEPAPTPTAPPEETEIHRFDVTAPGAPSYVASGKVAGRLLNQYSLSEYEGHLRAATTIVSPDGRGSSSTVHVLDARTLARTGEVGGLGEGERIYSVRFIGPAGYCVTFRQVDPLYALDLRDPAAPKVTGELKITGYSAYLHPGAAGRLIGIGQEASEKGRTLGTQISLFDVSDPAAPRRLSQLFQRDSGSEAEWDPHAFLYWPKTGLSVVPLYQQNESGALVLRIGDSGVERLGMIKHPEHRQNGDQPYQPGIQRSMVIGSSIWTLSQDGLQVNDAATLAAQAWVPFR